MGKKLIEFKRNGSEFKTNGSKPPTEKKGKNQR